MISKDLLQQGIVDYIIPEPNDGAHTDVHETALRIKTYLIKEIKLLKDIRAFKLVHQRYKKYRTMGREDKRLAQCNTIWRARISIYGDLENGFMFPFQKQGMFLY